MIRLQRLRKRYAGLMGEALLRPLIEKEFQGKIAVISSFGTESAVLLHIVAMIDKHIPIVCIDTGMRFKETLQYRDTLVSFLGLTDVRMVGQSEVELQQRDPDSTLWQQDRAACCRLRKVEPSRMIRDLFPALVDGRKRYQDGQRADIPFIDEDRGLFKISPLAEMTRDEIETYFIAYDLPRHPLEKAGYPSVGCHTCTDPIDTSNPSERRNGRRELIHGECGIHVPQ